MDRIARQLSAYLDGELTPDETRTVREHLDACASCRTELEALRDTKRLLGRLRDVEAPPDLEAAILQRLEQPRPRWFTWPRPVWPRPALVGATSVLVAILVAVPVVNGYRDRLRAAEVSPDVFIRSAVQSAADDPFMDRAYISLVSSDANLRLIGEEPRGPVR
ncbi:MAG: anti-sigma factor [Armatimonadota bacterium]|nr:anti-sigma factor [Armatimonadota bacterium]